MITLKLEDYLTIVLLEQALKKVNKTKNRLTLEAGEFDENKVISTLNLLEEIANKTYEVGEYKEFKIYEPKERIIYAPTFKDKVVQIWLNNILKYEYRFKYFIKDSYGSIDARGTHKCADKIQENMNKAQATLGTQARILKLDVKKFFYSIDREILKAIYKKQIADPNILWLLNKIIDSADQIDEKGLPLGNTISQLSANVYMNELDQFIKRTLRVKYYVRYMDDMILILENIERAREVKEQVENYLNQKLHLELNQDKSKIFPIKQGVNAIGYKIYSTHKKLRNRSKKKFKQIVKELNKDIAKTTYLTLEQYQHYESRLNSWMGHAGHAASRNFIISQLKKNPNLILAGNKLKIYRIYERIDYSWLIEHDEKGLEMLRNKSRATYYQCTKPEEYAWLLKNEDEIETKRDTVAERQILENYYKEYYKTRNPEDYQWLLEK